MEISVKYLPLVTVSLIILAIIVSLGFALGNKKIAGSLPYNGGTRTISLESCILAQALNVTWLLVSFCIYVKYRQVKDVLNRYSIGNKKILNRTAMQIGLMAAFGISIIANSQEINLLYIHWCGVILLFGFGAVYQCLQTALYRNLSKILGQENITWLRIVLSILSLIAFTVFLICAMTAYTQYEEASNEINQESDGYKYFNWNEGNGGFILHNISLIFEWICAVTATLYFGLFYWEFKKITLYEPDVFVEDKATTELNMERTNAAFQDA